MKRPDYVPAGSRRAARAPRHSRPDRARAVGPAVLAFVALNVLAAVVAVALAVLVHPDAVRWVQP